LLIERKKFEYFPSRAAKKEKRSAEVARAGGRRAEKSELKPLLSTGFSWRNQKEEKQKDLKFSTASAVARPIFTLTSKEKSYFYHIA